MKLIVTLIICLLADSSDDESYTGNEELFRVMVQCHLSNNTKDKILNVLRTYTNPCDIHMLPKCFKTAVGDYPRFNVRDIDGDDKQLNDDGENEEYPPTVDEDHGNNVWSTLKCGLGCFIYFGVEEWMRRNVRGFNPSISEQRLSINCDGLRIFTKSRKGFWTILGRFEEGAVFPIALYYGNGKPKYRDEFLIDFVNEVLEIQGKGVVINEKVYTIYIWAGIFDSSARSFILNTVQYNAYGGCYICTEHGEYENHRMFFQGINAPLRDIDPCSSIIFRVLDVSNIPIDVMHLLDLGVLCKVLTLKTSASSKLALTPSMKSILSTNIQNLSTSFPKEFHLPPRGLDDIKFYTAKEHRILGLYAGPIVYKGIFSKQEYNHFNSLHVAYRILSDEKAVLNDQMLDYAEELLRNYVIDFTTIYRPCYISYNVHALIHIVHYVRRYRLPVGKFSAYPFETFNKELKGHVKNTNAPPVQVGRRIHEATIFQKTRENHSTSKEQIRLSSKTNEEGTVFRKCYTSKYYFDNHLNNRFCEMEGGRIFAIHSFIYRDSVPCVRGVFVDKHLRLRDLYSVPCNSSVVDEYKVEIDGTTFDGELEVHSVASIIGKYMCLPLPTSFLSCSNGYVLSKLLH